MVPQQSLVVGAAQGCIVKVLVTGAAGQLGRELVDAANVGAAERMLREATPAPREPVLFTMVATTRADLDVTSASAVSKVLRRERPDVIVHAAAWTAVDACEADAARAMMCNGTSTQHVVAGAREIGARVVYVSTDYVFDGNKPTAYIETDAPNPQSVYGKSKLAGEQAVDPDIDSVVRVSWLCGRHGANMVKTIMRLAAQHETLQFVDDQIGNPTFADDAARMILRLVAQRHTGVWHVTNQGSVSWYEFAREVLRALGQDPDRVKPVKTRDLVPARPAPRPANSVLENRALRDAGITLLDDFRTPLARLIHRLKNIEDRHNT